jgi:CRP/FNR family transcriptional regulator, cyclic AMP receptor protein
MMPWDNTSWIDALGYAASLSVLATFCMSTMMPLRYTAIASNMLFATFGYFDHIRPVLLLHVVLLPINIIRLVQIKRLVRDIGPGTAPSQFFHSLVPFMRERRLNAGQVLVRKGELADRLYYLVKGELVIEEIGKVVGPGSMIGEIGIFAPHQRRTATVRSKTDCSLYELTEVKVKELYFENRSFGYAVLQLIITRLLENQEARQDLDQVASANDHPPDSAGQDEAPAATT